MRTLLMAVASAFCAALATHGDVAVGPSQLRVPCPVGGYEALQENIEYPMLFWKAGFESVFRVSVELDSTGNVLSVGFHPFKPEMELAKADSMLFDAIRPEIQSAKWNPAMLDDRPIAGEISVPILFFLTDNLEQKEEDMKEGYVTPFRGPAVTVGHELPYICR